MYKQVMVIGLLAALTINSNAHAQEGGSVSDTTIISEEVINSATKASQELGLPVALIKVDAQGAPVSGEQTLMISAQKESETTPAPTKEDLEKSGFGTVGEISFVAGFPSAPGIRAELKTLKGTVGGGVEGSTGMGFTFNGALLVNITPLAALGINNVYGGYRLYGIKPTVNSAEVNTAKISTFVAGLRLKRFYVEAGNGKLRRIMKSGQVENDRQWTGSVGYVIDVFKRK